MFRQNTKEYVMRKKIIIIAIVIILIVAAVLVFVYSKNKDKKIDLGNNGAPELSKTIESVKFVDQEVKNNKLQIIKNDNKAYELLIENNYQETQKSNFDFNGILEANWSPDKNRIIVLATNDGSNKNFDFSEFKKGTNCYFYIDLTTSQIVRLDRRIKGLAWKDNNSIFYTYIDFKNNVYSLNVAEASGENWKKILDLEKEIYNLKYDAKNNKLFAIQVITQSDFNGGKIIQIDLKNNNQEYLTNDENSNYFILDPAGDVIFNRLENQNFNTYFWDKTKKKEYKLTENQASPLFSLDSTNNKQLINIETIGETETSKGTEIIFKLINLNEKKVISTKKTSEQKYLSPSSILLSDNNLFLLAEENLYNFNP